MGQVYWLQHSRYVICIRISDMKKFEINANQSSINAALHGDLSRYRQRAAALDADIQGVRTRLELVLEDERLCRKKEQHLESALERRRIQGSHGSDQACIDMRNSRSPSDS